MRCEDVVAALDAFRTGEAGREARAISAHLLTCSSCAAELALVARVAGRLAGLRRPAPAALSREVLGSLGPRYGRVDTALGPVWVAFGPRGVTLVHLGLRDGEGFLRACEERLGHRPVAGEVPLAYAAALRGAAEGKKTGAIPVDLQRLPVFERRVLATLARIPRGEVRPYAWLAREAGRPRAVRAVGNALAKNPVPLLLPCHRVVPSTGGVGGYRFGREIKRAVLEREGAPVAELERLAREGVRCVGCRTTRIYCLPGCRHVRRTRAGNRVPFATAAEAAAAGYRPCRRCRPLASAA